MFHSMRRKLEPPDMLKRLVLLLALALAALGLSAPAAAKSTEQLRN